jgi:hypothetical protein
MRTTPEKIALVVGLLSALIATIGPILVVPQFRIIYESFNAKLSILTNFFIYYHHALWLLPITVIWVWNKWPSPKYGALLSCLIGLLGLALIFSVGITAVYLPILNLEAGA